MNPVLREELSALIDGELDPRRAREVELQIAADSQLKLEFEKLRRLDLRWRLAGRSSGFAPEIAPTTLKSWSHNVVFGAMVLALLGTRVAVRLIDQWPLALILQVLALAAVLVWVVRRALPRQPDRGPAVS